MGRASAAVTPRPRAEAALRPEFWLDAWESGRTGFHIEAPHGDLVDHCEGFQTGVVIVPLCGATHDLRWLAQQGHHAVGVELSPIAAAQLIKRESLSEGPQIEGFRVYQGEGMTLLQGDWFALTPAVLAQIDAGSVTGMWDRAALVAMHPDQRVAYVQKERQLLGAGRLLLSVFEYDQSKLSGPPWSVPPAVVRELWPESKLIDEATRPMGGRFEAAGIGTITRQLYCVDGPRSD